MFEIIFEIAVIIGIICLQGFIFLTNRQKIAWLTQLFPAKSQLKVRQEYVSASGQNVDETRNNLTPEAAEKLA